MVKRQQKLKLKFKDVEEHVSPGGRTKYTTKPGADDGAKRKALGRARKKQGHVAPREAAKASREDWMPEPKQTVSPGGNTVYSRPMTPSPLKKGNPMKVHAKIYGRELHLLQQRQSARLLDARARKEKAAAGIDGRLSLGLDLLRGAVFGTLEGLSELQLRGTLVNVFVALLTPHQDETIGENLGPELVEERYGDWFPWSDAVEKFYRERSRNSRLLVQAGCCQLVAEALKIFPDDLEIAHSAFPLLYFLLSECGSDMTHDVARMVIHHGTVSLALDALLRPFDEWKWPDFKSAGDVFWAVVTKPHPYHDDVEARERWLVNASLEEKDDFWALCDAFELGMADFGGPYHVIPNQPCHDHFCHDSTSNREMCYPSDRNRRSHYRWALYDVSALVMQVFCRLNVKELGPIPDDFATRWSRRLGELLDELLTDNLTGYPTAANQTMNTLAHCFDATGDLAEEPRWLSLLRAAGCFDVISRAAVTEIPFPTVLQRVECRAKDSDVWVDKEAARGRKGVVHEWSNALESWRKMKQDAARILQRFHSG